MSIYIVNMLHIKKRSCLIVLVSLRALFKSSLETFSPFPLMSKKFNLVPLQAFKRISVCWLGVSLQKCKITDSTLFTAVEIKEGEIEDRLEPPRSRKLKE